MAIDPLTAKLLAQAAARAATDEESRRRTLILILAPILGLLLLIAFILYLISRQVRLWHLYGQAGAGRTGGSWLYHQAGPV